MIFLWAFVIGGAWCVLAQLLIDLTDLKPADVLVGYVVLGVALTGTGLYGHIKDFAGSGATVPLVGFGYALAKGVDEAMKSDGFLGILKGGFTATAAGLSVAIVFALFLSLFSKSKEK